MNRRNYLKALAFIILLPLTLTSCGARESLPEEPENNTNNNSGEYDSSYTNADSKLHISYEDLYSSVGVKGDMYYISKFSNYYIKGDNGYIYAGNAAEEEGNGHSSDLPSLFVNKDVDNALGKDGDFSIHFSPLTGNAETFSVKFNSSWTEFKAVLDAKKEYYKANPSTDFWAFVPSAYSDLFNNIMQNNVSPLIDCEVNSVAKGSLEELHRDMVVATALGDFPGLVMTNRHSMYQYLAYDILQPLDRYLNENEISDYYPSNLVGSQLYDNGKKDVQKRLYGLPFYESTLMLGYNGVFVDYCATLDPTLVNIPVTWDEWVIQGPKYDNIYKDLMGRYVFGNQNTEGLASDFEVYTEFGLPATTQNENGEIILQSNGKKLLLDMSHVVPNTSRLIACDEDEDVFITLIQQWGAKYTEVADSENTKIAKKRIGSVLFNSSQNQPIVVDCMQFFNRLDKQHIFGTATALNEPYVCQPFANCKCMFMICPTGLQHPDSHKWNHRMRVAPIPYKESSRKVVTSNTISVSITDNAYAEGVVKVAEALTTGESQANWTINTGLYPCSQSATNSSTYQSFLSNTSCNSPTKVAYREQAKMNNEEYMNANSGWIKYIDSPFCGSITLRNCIKELFYSMLRITDVNNNSEYYNKLNEFERKPMIAGETCIRFVH